MNLDTVWAKRQNWFNQWLSDTKSITFNILHDDLQTLISFISNTIINHLYLYHLHPDLIHSDELIYWPLLQFNLICQIPTIYNIWHYKLALPTKSMESEQPPWWKSRFIFFEAVRSCDRSCLLWRARTKTFHSFQRKQTIWIDKI